MMEKQFIIDKVEKLILPVIKELGLELVDIEYLQDGGYWYLRVFIEKLDDDISLGDCATLSNRIDEDIDKLISEKFFLEVSSPGIERPLKKIEDFIRFKGENIKISLKHKLNNHKNYSGILLNITNEDTVLLKKDDDILEIPFKEIQKANLLFDFSKINELD
ncbi:MAG: ribosome maturation factor RimP [Fusobacteriaceae bacterium]